MTDFIIPEDSEDVVIKTETSHTDLFCDFEPGIEVKMESIDEKDENETFMLKTDISEDDYSTIKMEKFVEEEEDPLKLELCDSKQRKREYDKRRYMKMKIHEDEDSKQRKREYMKIYNRYNRYEKKRRNVSNVSVRDPIHQIQPHPGPIKVILGPTVSGYKCFDCEEDYESHTLLVEHFKSSAHKARVAKKRENVKIPTPKVKRFQCPHCKAKFTQKNNVGSHIKTVHEGHKRKSLRNLKES